MPGHCVLLLSLIITLNFLQTLTKDTHPIPNSCAKNESSWCQLFVTGGIMRLSYSATSDEKFASQQFSAEFSCTVSNIVLYIGVCSTETPLYQLPIFCRSMWKGVPYKLTRVARAYVVSTLGWNKDLQYIMRSGSGLIMGHIDLTMRPGYFLQYIHITL